MNFLVLLAIFILAYVFLKYLFGLIVLILAGIYMLIATIIAKVKRA